MALFRPAPLLNPEPHRRSRQSEPGVEIRHCRYTFDAKHQPDGGWKTVKLKIELQEIWRGLGFYPGGQGQGL